MNGSSKIVRIFVCSTFREFGRERNQLAKEVFPELETMCRRAGLVFQAVDLRWGVSKQDSTNHQTIPICLSEIRKCQEQSPGLNFLVMLGGDYGSVLAPAEIPAEDWELLMSGGGLDAEAQSLLKNITAGTSTRRKGRTVCRARTTGGISPNAGFRRYCLRRRSGRCRKERAGIALPRPSRNWKSIRACFPATPGVTRS